MRAKHYNRVTDNSIRYNGDIITRSPFQVKHLFGIKKDIFTVQISKKIQSNTIQVESGKYVHGN